ncbi:MAG: hypothetical protein NDJ19_00610 [Ramlibacter sp.]|nr:hypothetical protein [Ramlibacter sp.]
MSQYGPAAGASGGRAPLLSVVHVPEFLRLDHAELAALLGKLRDPLCTHVFILVLAHGLFENGEFLGGYARLMDLCRPSHPERGTRRPGPSMKQIRRAVADLIGMGLLSRDAGANKAQGQLRLRAMPRQTKLRPAA